MNSAELAPFANGITAAINRVADALESNAEPSLHSQLDSKALEVLAVAGLRQAVQALQAVLYCEHSGESCQEEAGRKCLCSDCAAYKLGMDALGAFEKSKR
jgi:hypothetical protein